jgi:hypothetical protein
VALSGSKLGGIDATRSPEASRRICDVHGAVLNPRDAGVFLSAAGCTARVSAGLRLHSGVLVGRTIVARQHVVVGCWTGSPHAALFFACCGLRNAATGTRRSRRRRRIAGEHTLAAGFSHRGTAVRHSILSGLIMVAALSIGKFQFSDLVAGFLNRTYPVVLLQAFYGATGLPAPRRSSCWCLRWHVMV